MSKYDVQGDWLDEALGLITVDIMRYDVVDIKEAKAAVLAHEQEAVLAAINQATQPYYYNMPIKSVRSRNTAFKLYAVKFMNSKLKERRELMIAKLKEQQGEL